MFDDPVAEALIDGAQSYIDVAIAPLRAEIASLRAEIAHRDIAAAELRSALNVNMEWIKGEYQKLGDLVRDTVERSVSSIRVPRDGLDGKDADPEIIRQMVVEAVSEIPPASGKDGKDADPNVIRQMVAEAVSEIPPALPGRAGKDADPEVIRKMVAEAVDGLPPALPGRDADPDVIRQMVIDAVSEVPPALPGRDADPDVIRQMVIEAVAELPPALPGQAGKDADPEVIRGMVLEAVAALPAAPPGKDGKDADPEQILSEIQRQVAALPPPKDGYTLTEDDIRPLVASEVAKSFSAAPVPRDGRDGADVVDALIDRDGHLALTLSNGSVKRLGRVIGQDVDMESVHTRILSEVAKIPTPKDGKDGLNGKDGFGFEDMTEEVRDGGRTIVRRYQRGDDVREFVHSIYALQYKGIYKDGQTYQHGDFVTLSGSLWHADQETTERPTEGAKTWKLAAKRGRDGKQGDPGLRGKDGDPGRPGRDLTSMGPDGRKWSD